jgi:hypothetical protein
MLAAALRYSALDGFDVPYHDEWGFVEQLTGENITFKWLWSPYGDHRLPLAKPIWLFWIKLTNSFRVGAYVNIAVLGVLALAMIATARRLPGRISYTDAFFPLLMLHQGQGINFLWSYQISEMLPAFLQCVVIMLVVRHPTPTSGAALRIGLCLALIGLAGPGGLPFALALALWLAMWGLRQWRTVTGLLAFCGAFVTFDFVGLYFWDLKDPAQTVTPTAAQVSRGAIEYLSVGFGPATAPVWAFAGWGVALLIAGAMALAAIAWYRQPAERWRALGLFLMLGSGLALALAMGWARGPYGPGGALSHWYVIFGFPSLCAVYFSWLLYAPVTGGSLMRMCLFILMCGLLPLNTYAGRKEAQIRGEIVRRFEQDIHDGVSPILIAQRHAYPITNAEIYRVLPTHFESDLRKLHRAGVGLFRDMRGPFIDQGREWTVAIHPAKAAGITWKDGRAICLSDDPYLVFALPKPMFVSAIRLGFSYDDAVSPAHCEFYWCRSDRNDFNEKERYRAWQQETAIKNGEGLLQYKDIVINDTLDRFRIDPDNKPCIFTLKEITVLVPEETPQP